jgi:hypothetical protein
LRVEGYVYEELAHIMQIRKGVVGALLSRALRNFRNSEALAEQPYYRSRDTTDTFSLISQLRLALAETQYRRRIQHRIWAYVFTLGLLTAAAALAAVLMMYVQGPNPDSKASDSSNLAKYSGIHPGCGRASAVFCRLAMGQSLRRMYDGLDSSKPYPAPK